MASEHTSNPESRVLSSLLASAPGRLLRILAIFLVCHELSALSSIFPPGGAYPHLIWLTEGANLAALVLFRKEAWAGVLLAQWVSGTGMIGSICSVASCALRLGIAQYLFDRFHFNRRLERLRDFALLVIGGGVVATGIGTFAGGVLIRLFGFVPRNQFWTDWRIWWIGDLAGILILTPLILTWSDPAQRRGLVRRWQEFSLVFVILLIVNFWLSRHLTLSDYALYPLAYSMNPLLIWAALRWGPIGVTTAGVAAFSQTLSISWKSWQTAAHPHALIGFPLPMMVVSFAWLMTLILAFAVQALYRARESIRLANQSIATLVETSPLAIVALSPAGLVLQWNQAAQEMFGWSAAEMVGRPLALPQWTQLRDVFGQALSGRALSCVRSGRFRRNGELLDVHVDAAPMQAADGKIVAIVAILADVTAQRRMEEELQQRHHLEAMGRLAGGIAHDFNNILSVILGHAELLLAHGSTHGLRRRLVRLRDAALQSSSLTSRLLAFSRQRRIEPQSLDLNDLVRRMRPLLQERLGAEIVLVLQLDSRPCPVVADLRQCEQLLLNLCMSAAEGNAQVNRVEVATSLISGEEGRSEQSLLSLRFDTRPPALAVHDAGAGIDKSDRHGAGLGLAIARSIVQEANAAMRVSNDAGQGVRILIEFSATTPEVHGSGGMPPSRASIMIGEAD